MTWELMIRPSPHGRGLGGPGFWVPLCSSAGWAPVSYRKLGLLQVPVFGGMLKPLLLSAFPLDTEGKAHALHNDSGCGLWVLGAPDGSRKVSVSYTSCYVFEWVSDPRDPAGAGLYCCSGCPDWCGSPPGWQLPHYCGA